MGLGEIVYIMPTGKAMKGRHGGNLMRKKFTLTPAYDLLSTTLVIPEDTEELALTLNGRKRKLRRSDFIHSITASGIDEKVIDNLCKKWSRLMPQWFELIDRSFLPEEMKRPYKQLILQRMLLLK